MSHYSAGPVKQVPVNGRPAPCAPRDHAPDNWQHLSGPAFKVVTGAARRRAINLYNNEVADG